MSLSYPQIIWWTVISLLAALQFFALYPLGVHSMLMQRIPGNVRMKLVEQSGHDYFIVLITMIAYQVTACIVFTPFHVLVLGWIPLDLAFALPMIILWLRRHNLRMRRVYDILLSICGSLGPFLLGCFMSCYFFGNVFTVGDKSDIAGTFAWGDIEGISIFGDWRTLAFGLMVLFLTRTQTNIWYLHKIDEQETKTWNRRQLNVNGLAFLVTFSAAMYAMLVTDGYQVVGENKFEVMHYKYLINYLDLPAALACLLLGFSMICAGIGLGIYPLYQNKLHGSEKSAGWHCSIGAVLVITSFFMVAGFNDTPFFPSTIDMESSLTIYNSSASDDDLRIASYILGVVIVMVAGSYFILHRRKRHETM